MNEFYLALGQYQYLQIALAAGLLAALGCGLIGPFVVVRKMTFPAAGIAHSVLGGVGVALFYGFHPLAGALVAAVLAAILIGWIRLHRRTSADTFISALWVIGMAAGILFISRLPGYQADLISYLFGNILLVPPEELWFMATLDAVLLLGVGLWRWRLPVEVFDGDQAGSPELDIFGGRVKFDLLLLILIALTVVLLIQVVGLIMVLALLTLPTAIASQYVHSLTRMMLIATLLGMALTFLGLAMSYQPNLPPGPGIALLTGLAYVVSSLLSRHESAS